MLITGTSDKIQFKLGSTATTQLPFTVDYNNYTSTAVSLVTNNGTSNDTTAVDLVPSPSSNQQNELRYCSIYNADSVSETVIIQVYDGTNTRVVFRAVLAPRDTLQYQLEKGWEVISSTGNKKTYGIHVFNNSMKGEAIWRPGSTTGVITLLTNRFFYAVLGRAEKSYSSIDVSYYVTTAASSATYAELGIYTSPVTTFGGTQFAIGRRIGFTSIASAITGLGVKKTNISITGVLNPGELIFAVINTNHSGTLIIRSASVTDATATYFNAIMDNSVVGGASGTRVSFIETGPYLTGASNPIWLTWQGN